MPRYTARATTEMPTIRAARPPCRAPRCMSVSGDQQRREGGQAEDGQQVRRSVATGS